MPQVQRSRGRSRFWLGAGIVLLVLALAVALFWPTLTRWNAIDRCLDSGGKYDYQHNSCVH